MLQGKPICATRREGGTDDEPAFKVDSEGALPRVAQVRGSAGSAAMRNVIWTLQALDVEGRDVVRIAVVAWGTEPA